MRLSLYILGVLAGLVCIAAPALAQYVSGSDRSISVRHSKHLGPAASQATLVLSPRLRETPAVGSAIQRDGRIIMIRALPRMANSCAPNTWYFR
jgi:hypothetical protein